MALASILRRLACIPCAVRNGAALAVLLGALALTAQAPPVAPAAPAVRVQVPATLRAGAPREARAMLVNESPAPVVVLPSQVRLRIEGPGAEYVPYPGPPIDPWGGARELAPGAVATVEFPDLSDRRGVWRLPPGTYRVVATYDVPQALAAPSTLEHPARVWRGHVESAPATLRVE